MPRRRRSKLNLRTARPVPARSASRCRTPARGYAEHPRTLLRGDLRRPRQQPQVAQASARNHRQRIVVVEVSDAVPTRDQRKKINLQVVLYPGLHRIGFRIAPALFREIVPPVDDADLTVGPQRIGRRNPFEPPLETVIEPQRPRASGPDNGSHRNFPSVRPTPCAGCTRNNILT